MGAVLDANSMEELTAKCESFLKFCTHYNLTVQADKVQVGVRELKYLGMVVCEQGKFLDPSRIEALLEIRRPQSVREVKQLLGAFNTYYVANMQAVLRYDRRVCPEKAAGQVKTCWVSAPRAGICPACDLSWPPIFQHRNAVIFMFIIITAATATRVVTLRMTRVTKGRSSCHLLHLHAVQETWVKNNIE